jgi:Transposase
VLDAAEQPVMAGRFGTDSEGYRLLLAAGRQFPHRLWAVEGCQGVGRHLAQRLVADGETVLDVPAKLSARTRVFSTGQGRKTDATDAHSVAVVALRTPTLRQVQPDDRTVALRLLVDRRDELGAARTLTINRLRRLLVELVPGGAKKALTARQARKMLAAVPAGDVVRETRRQLGGLYELRESGDGGRNASAPLANVRRLVVEPGKQRHHGFLVGGQHSGMAWPEVFPVASLITTDTPRHGVDLAAGREGGGPAPPQNWASADAST